MTFFFKEKSIHLISFEFKKLVLEEYWKKGEKKGETNEERSETKKKQMRQICCEKMLILNP